MKITIEIDSKTELEKLSALFKSLKINKVDVVASDDTDKSIVKGDKTINPTELFGIWKDNPRNIKGISNSSWQRDQNI